MLHPIAAGFDNRVGSMIPVVSHQVKLLPRKRSPLHRFSSRQHAPIRQMLVATVALGVSLLTGCGSSEPPGSTGSSGEVQDTLPAVSGISLPATQNDGSASSGIGPDSSWITTVTYVGHGLTLSIGGVETLRIACVRDSREMNVDVADFTSIGSEERLSLGIDDEPYVFVAQVTPPPPAGVHATRSIDEEVLTALRSARTISAFYGSQTSGPHAAPESALLESFVSGCRRAPAR